MIYIVGLPTFVGAFAAGELGAAFAGLGLALAGVSWLAAGYGLSLLRQIRDAVRSERPDATAR